MPKPPKTYAPVTTKQSASEAFETILRHNFDYLVTWEPAARAWEDIEGVHQMRVSFRRMRSAMSAFRSTLPRKAVKEWSDELRWLGSQLGMARDLDVFIDEGLGPVRGKLRLAGEDKLLAVAKLNREIAYKDVTAMLDSERYARFKKEFPRWLAGKKWQHGDLKKKHKKSLEMPVAPFARRLLDTLERKVLEAGSHVNKESAVEMHRLRIQCKKLRYASEFFTPVLNGLDEFIGHMKRVQSLLGILNDVSVMQNLIDNMLAEVDDHETLEYAGGIVGWRTRQFYETLDTFDDCWGEFIHAKHPWWSKFGTDI